MKADPTDWLLEDDNPSVRYLTLVDILGRPAGDREVAKARADIMEKGAVPLILAKQEEGGYWDQPDRMYVAKYKGTVWQLIILAEHLADPERPAHQEGLRVPAGAFPGPRERRILPAPRRQDGRGQAQRSDTLPDRKHGVEPDQARISEGPQSPAGDRLDCTRYQRFDDAIADPPTGWPYDKFEICFGKHTCHMGAVKALKALAEIPPRERSADVQRTIREGVEYILKHHVHKRSHNLTQVSKPGWRRFGFPLMYQTDVLEILGILTRLGYKDERMQEAIDVVVSKQDSSGRWKLADNFNGRFQVDIETKGQPSKWITLNALRVLKGYYG